MEAHAWDIYCKETAGDADARDFWHELPPYVQEYYLQRAKEERYE